MASILYSPSWVCRHPYQRNIAYLYALRNKHCRRLLTSPPLVSMYALGHMCGDDRDRVLAVFALASHRYAPGLASLD